MKTVALSDIFHAAYVFARRNRLVKVDDSRPWQVEFHFPITAQPDVNAYLEGGMIEARLYAAALRDLRAIVARARRGEGREVSNDAS